MEGLDKNDVTEFSGREARKTDCSTEKEVHSTSWGC